MFLSKSIKPCRCMRNAASTVAGLASEPAWNSVSQSAFAPSRCNLPQAALQSSWPSRITATDSAGMCSCFRRVSSVTGLVSSMNTTRGSRLRRTCCWRFFASFAVMHCQCDDTSIGALSAADSAIGVTATVAPMSPKIMVRSAHRYMHHSLWNCSKSPARARLQSAARLRHGQASCERCARKPAFSPRNPCHP